MDRKSEKKVLPSPEVVVKGSRRPILDDSSKKMATVKTPRVFRGEPF